MLKFNYLLVVLTLAASQSLLSQSLSVGLRGEIGNTGLRITSNLPPSQLGNLPESVASYGVGAYLNCPFGRFFALQCELDFAGRGWRTNFITYYPNGGQFQEFINKSNFNYLEMPIIGQIGTGGKNFQLYLEGGVSFGYAVSGQVHQTNKMDGSVIEDTTQDIDFNNPDYSNFKRTHWGRYWGGGLRFRIDDAIITLGARQFHSLSNLNAEELPEHTRLRWGGWGIQVGCATTVGN